MSYNFLHKPRDYKSINIWKNVSEKDWQDPNWQIHNTIRDVDTLSKVIPLNNYQIKEINKVVQILKAEGKSPLRLSPYYATLIQDDPFNPIMLPGERGEDRLDPIFWQSVPTPAHLLFPNTGDEGAMSEGTRSYGAAYQRYPNRVAIFVAENTSCASYCTHCQRAKSLDSNNSVDISQIRKALFYVAHNQNIDEVLVTGGDSLMISKGRLQFVLEELSKIPHVRAIRIASRVPVVMPMGITDELLELIKESSNKYNDGFKKYVYFMTHINHHQEITQAFADAVEKIRNNGFSIRNQAVFLNHVNSNYRTLAETFRRMLWTGVEPYYLMQCHKEKGIAHFITPIQIGKIYMKHLQGWLSGMAKPTYVANLNGGGGKVLLMPTGHDTMNTGRKLEDNISSSFATVHTWDGRTIDEYEALGKSTKEEYDNAISIMNRFIGREGVFKPYMILVDEKGTYLKTSNSKQLPDIYNDKKINYLNYRPLNNGKIITNPAEVKDYLDSIYLSIVNNN